MFYLIFNKASFHDHTQSLFLTFIGIDLGYFKEIHILIVVIEIV